MKRISICILLAITIPVFVQISLAQEPCDGDGIEVLNSDICGLDKWITVKDSATVCQIRCVVENPEDPGKTCGIDPHWIGGTVEADEYAEYGFNFDPATIEIAEIVAEAYQTTTCQIAEDPKGFSGGHWFIPVSFRDIR